MGQFIKQTFASIIGSLVGLTLFLAVGASGLVLLLMTATSTEEQPQVKDKSFLVFDLSMEVRDNRLPSSLGQTFSGEEKKTITLRQVLETLDKATKDKNIIGLLLDGRNAETLNGYATLEEIRTALEKFRAAGKKIVAYDIDWSEKKYYLASVADRLILNPLGSLEINGLSSQQIFFSGAMEKYGIGVQVIRVGDFKAAVEPYTRQNISPQNREQTQQLLNDLWANFAKSVGTSRKLSSQKIVEITNSQAILNAKEAQASGLVDNVAYFDEVVEELKKQTGSDQKSKSFRHIPIEEYASFESESIQKNSSDRKIAIIYADGTIVSGKGGISEIGSDRFVGIFRKLREDDDVKAVVLRVNSPGGSATASEEILREVLLTRKKKPVIVSMGDYAASGGYWVATGGDYIFAQENTITGSIGVFGLLPNLEKIAKNNGITSDVVKTSPYADIKTNVRAKTTAELAIYQKSVNLVYDLFLDKVSEARNLSKDKVSQIAQGRVWSGQHAKNIGLVDRIGGLSEAIAYAAEKAKLGKKGWDVEEYPQQRSFEEEVIDRIFSVQELQAGKKLDPITNEFLKLKSELEILQSINDPKGIYARLPFNFNIE
ncbi:MAG: signal peptide peptidase SppA [Xenococcaceae cyanobacterium]